MADARCRRITITVEADGAVFQASGRTIDFPGYLRAYVEGSDDPESRPGRPRRGAARRRGGRVAASAAAWSRKATRPSRPTATARPSLTRALEEMGIGRPSTYAQIIDTILAREYVFKTKRGNVLVPTWTAFAVSQLLEAPPAQPGQLPVHGRDGRRAGRHQPRRAEPPRIPASTSTSATTIPGLKEQLKNKVDEIDARDVSRILHRQAGGPGRRSSFAWAAMGRSSNKATAAPAIPDKMPPDELTLEPPWRCSTRRARARSRWASARETQKPIFLKVGRFGPYVQRGTAEDDEKPQNASLLKGMQPEDVTLDVALKLLCRCRASWASTRQTRPAGGGPQRALWPLCEVRRRNPLAARRPFAAGRDAGAGAGVAGAAEGGRGGGRPQGAAQGLRRVAGHGQPVQLLAGPLRALCGRRRDQRLAAAGRSPEEVTLEYALNLLKGAGRAGAFRLVVAPSPRHEVRRRRPDHEGSREEGPEEDGQEKAPKRKATRKKTTPAEG